MKRQIVRIDEDKCNGCGECIINCPEGALQLIDGKARVVSELACDGLGACIGHCPQGAITVEEREAEAYDEIKVMENIVKCGPATIQAHLQHLREHGQQEYLKQAMQFLHQRGLGGEMAKALPQGHGGCPGSRTIDRTKKEARSSQGPAVKLQSELRQWPVQLRLLNPTAPYLKNADLLIAADCVPFAYANFHQRFLSGKVVIVFCPKLDPDLESYIEKLTGIIKENDIKSITVARMEVPCCGGTTKILEEALQRAGKNMVIHEYVISLEGEIL
jgi:NAD-dependent dihydropyrimidine dehydrogenase PreA subunit